MIIWNYQLPSMQHVLVKLEELFTYADYEIVHWQVVPADTIFYLIVQVKRLTPS